MKSPEELQKRLNVLRSLSVALLVVLAFPILFLMLGEASGSEQGMGIAFITVFVLLAAVFLVNRKGEELEKRILIAQAEAESRDREKNKRLINAVANYLEGNSETGSGDWKTVIPSAQKKHIRAGAKIALTKLLEQHEFERARAILDYYEVDDFELFPVMQSLAKFKKIGLLQLTPKALKLTLEDGETAYEKLPCNWQKIHTYLAPLEDEIEQADILDSGNIYITDQRVFFVGKKGSETVYLNDIAYMDHKEDALQFFRDEGLSEIFAFPTPHHATYARLLIEELMGR